MTNIVMLVYLQTRRTRESSRFIECLDQILFTQSIVKLLCDFSANEILCDPSQD